MKNTIKKSSKSKTDLPDTADDKKHLEPDEGTLDLPEVKDIPGQEHIHVPIMKSFSDTTISSDDEEGVGLFDDEDQIENSSSNVSKTEKKALQDAAEKMPGIKDDKNLKDAQLDNRDEDGEPLNEKTNISGSDLDVPGSEEDDADEEIGEEDEENNSYSISKQ